MLASDMKYHSRDKLNACIRQEVSRQDQCLHQRGNLTVQYIQAQCLYQTGSTTVEPSSMFALDEKYNSRAKLNACIRHEVPQRSQAQCLHQTGSSTVEPSLMLASAMKYYSRAISCSHQTGCTVCTVKLGQLDAKIRQYRK
jgi:hypothetical protein